LEPLIGAKIFGRASLGGTFPTFLSLLLVHFQFGAKRRNANKLESKNANIARYGILEA
jgi:hypothetical protein